VLGADGWEGSAGDAGVVDEDVEVAVVLGDVVVGGEVVGGLGDVKADEFGLYASGVEFGEGGFAVGQIAGADDAEDVVVLEVECSL